MKTSIIRKWLAGLCLGGVLVSATGVYAIAITDPNVVGTVVSGEPASEGIETIKANYLLSLALGVVDISHTVPGPPGPPAGTTDLYSTNPTYDFSGTVSGALKNDTGDTAVPAGWEYVWAKYDGPQGGAVLYYLGGAAVSLPSTSAPLWPNTAGQGVGLSHYTLFNPTTSVPDGGATVALMGLALGGLSLGRRFLKVPTA